MHKHRVRPAVATAVAIGVLASRAAAGDVTPLAYPSGAKIPYAAPTSAVLAAGSDPLQRTDTSAAAKPRLWAGLTEFKREWTDKGSPPEKTQTTLRLDWYLNGPISLLRLQPAFPDQNQADATLGSFFHPKMGDLKARVGFRSLPVARWRLAIFEEVTFPTADPASLGQQKYQLNTGFRAVLPALTSSWLRVDAQVNQTVSIAGDPSAADVDKTNFELAAKHTWHGETYVQIKVKPVIDWEKSARTGSVAECKGSVGVGARWSAWAYYGHLVWGLKAPGMYENKFSFGLIRNIGRFRRPIAAEE